MHVAFLARITTGTLVAALIAALGLGFVLNGLLFSEVTQSAKAEAIGQAAVMFQPVLGQLDQAHPVDRTRLNRLVVRAQAIPYVDRIAIFTTTGNALAPAGTVHDPVVPAVVRSGRVHSLITTDRVGVVRRQYLPLAGTRSGAYTAVIRLDLDDAKMRARARSQDAIVFIATAGAVALIVAAFFALIALAWPKVLRQQQELEQSAKTDSLTRLFNRTSFLAEVQTYLGAADKRRRTAAVYLVDLDRFKEINDIWGHQAGDAVLLLTAQRLVGAVRAHECVARLGGDEFAIFAPDLDDAEARRLGERIVEVLKLPFDVHGRTFTISASVGLSMYPDDAMTYDDLIARADQAMYASKETGTGPAGIFGSDRIEQRDSRQGLIMALRESLNRGEMSVWYEPLIDVATGRTFAIESHLRRNRPGHGLLKPDDFLPVARECGFTGELTPWLVRHVVQDVRRLAGQRVILRAFVTVGAEGLRDDSLRETIDRALTDFGVPAMLFGIELRACPDLRALADASVRLEKLREHGLALALDHFGAGTTSFAQLQTIRFDLIKADRSLVNADADETVTGAVLSSIARLTESLRIPLVVDGVDGARQLRLIQALGVQRAQGLAFSAPMPIDALEAFLIDATARV